jgi:glutathione S-transferase
LILIGMFDSPFVRRVAISMNLLGIDFEHRNWSVGKDFELIRQFNPLGRVPTLVQPDGETLVESAAILDFLDQQAGPERALLPPSGKQRREALRILAIATGAAEKGVSQIYETVFRPPEKRHQPWVERCHTQMHAALAELNRMSLARTGAWLIGDRMSQADITATCVFTFLAEALAINGAAATYPGLAAAAGRCEALPEFRGVKAAWYAPGEGT